MAFAENSCGIIISCRGEFCKQEIGIVRAILYKIVGGQEYAKKGRNAVPECGLMYSDHNSFNNNSFAQNQPNNEPWAPRRMLTNDTLNSISNFLQVIFSQKYFKNFKLKKIENYSSTI